MTTTRMVFGLTTISLTLAGCEASPRGTPADAHPPEALTIRAPEESATPPMSHPESAKPDVARLAYDPARRTLRVYDLAEPSARWVLTLPGAPMGVPVDGEYEFPASPDCDLDQVVLFYTLANRRPSPGVSLREIAETARQ